MLTNEYVKDLGKTFFDSIDLNWMNPEWKSEIDSYPEGLSESLYRTFYNHELVYPKEIIWDFINAKLRTQSDELNHLYETTKYEYNPIWNKDGTITEERTVEGTDGRTITDNGTRGVTENKKRDTKLTVDIDTTDTGTDNVATTGSASATMSDYPMNYTGKKPREDSESSSSGSSNETRNLAGTEDRTDIGEETNVNTLNETSGNTQTQTGNNKQTEKTTRTEQGNIGVTTTQAMIREEREIILCMYSHLVKEIGQYFYFSI